MDENPPGLEAFVPRSHSFRSWLCEWAVVELVRLFAQGENRYRADPALDLNVAFRFKKFGR